MARMDELGLHLAISGWASGEDAALVEADDPGPWLAVLELERSVITDQPDLVLELMGR